MDTQDPDDLTRRARAGDDQALSRLFEAQRERLVRMVAIRMDAGLRRRLDPADVVQEAWLAMVKRVDAWRADGSLSFGLWARLSTREAWIVAHRRHIGAQKRDAQREVNGIDQGAGITATALSNVFVASTTSPTQALRREEIRSRVLAAIEELEPIDREILALRHFEGLSNDDAARELGIDAPAASKRFVRALTRLKPFLAELARDQSGATS